MILIIKIVEGAENAAETVPSADATVTNII